MKTFYISVMKKGVPQAQPTQTVARRFLALACLASASLIMTALSSCMNADATKDASPWVRRSNPAFAGFYGAFAADASVLAEDDEYLMYYTEFDPNGDGKEDDGSGICVAGSADGSSWTTLWRSGPTPPFILEGGEEEDLETCFCLRYGGTYYLYYGAYPRDGIEVYTGSGPKETMGSSIRLAISDDGRSFTVQGDVITREPGWYDEDAAFSPSVIETPSGLFMVYAGHRYDLDHESGVYVLGATSPDGIAWTKLSAPLLKPGMQLPPEDPASGYAWMRSGTAEPDILQGPDGAFYLFFTGLDDVNVTRSIGIATASSIEGPYVPRPEPILRASRSGFDSGGVIAPDVLVDGDRLRLWYNGMGSNGSSWLLGYAEAPLSALKR